MGGGGTGGRGGAAASTREAEQERTYQKLRARAREVEQNGQGSRKNLFGGINGGEFAAGDALEDGGGATSSASSLEQFGATNASSFEKAHKSPTNTHNTGTTSSARGNNTTSRKIAQIDLPSSLATALQTLHSLLETSFQDQNYYTARAQQGTLVEGEFQSMKAARLLGVWVSYVDGLETLATTLGEHNFENQERLFSTCPPWWLLLDLIRYVYVPEMRELVLSQKPESKSKMASEALLAAESTVVKLMQHVVGYIKKDGLFVFSCMNFVACAAGDALCAEFLKNELAPLADIFRYRWILMGAAEKYHHSRLFVGGKSLFEQDVQSVFSSGCV